MSAASDVYKRQELYDDIKASESFRFHYEKKGLFMLCQTDKALEEEIKVAEIAKNEGLEVSTLTQEEIISLEPNVRIKSVGATYYKCDSHTTPHEFMEDMKAHLKASGVVFRLNESVIDLTVSNGKITSIQTSKEQLKADEFILAAGSWSSILSKKLGIKLLLQAGKGYRINTKQNTGITIPAILTERKVAITPMNGFTRFAGTMEIAGINHNINKVRVEAIANGVQEYYPDIKLSLIHI